MNDRLRARRFRILTIAGRIAIGAISLYTGFSKVKPPAGFPWSAASTKISLAMFAFDVEAYKILSPPAVSAVAHILPFFLFLVCLALTVHAFGATRRHTLEQAAVPRISRA